MLYLLSGCSKKHMPQNSHCMDGCKPVLWQHQQIYSLCPKRQHAATASPANQKVAL